MNSLTADPKWNSGWVYENGGISETLGRIRGDTLRHYGISEVLRARGMSDAEVNEAVESMARSWAQRFDPNSLIALCKAGQRFDARAAIPHLKARMLWVISSSDKIFPPDAQVEALVMSNDSPAQPVYLNLQSEYGHAASGADYRKWEDHLRGMLA
ncbi:hypothetical protein [Variovorax sp. E3]|uniref:hypothetical protein n=1 Tax=Variovorax sp. E3 TaxID=1914993 RepID=UPI0018DD428C|nr:hypothetical protein [Variovorax sp. E3]